MHALQGKTTIVTGGRRENGKQVAVELGRRGAAVVVAARTVEPNGCRAQSVRRSWRSRPWEPKA